MWGVLNWFTVCSTGLPCGVVQLQERHEAGAEQVAATAHARILTQSLVRRLEFSAFFFAKLSPPIMMSPCPHLPPTPTHPTLFTTTLLYHHTTRDYIYLALLGGWVFLMPKYGDSTVQVCVRVCVCVCVCINACALLCYSTAKKHLNEKSTIIIAITMTITMAVKLQQQ
jgi:hypothetical protein